MKKSYLLLVACLISVTFLLLQCIPMQSVSGVGMQSYGQPEVSPPSPVSPGLAATSAQVNPNPSSPITGRHVAAINDLFKKNNVRDGYVEIDRFGRIQLKGSYLNEDEVDVAFSLAQQTVGVKWVSPVDPENVAVPGWSKKLSEMMLEAAKKTTVKKSAGPPGPIKNRYALVVGIGNFKYRIRKLDYAKKDASDFYRYLVDPSRGGFSKNNTTILLNEDATRDNIANALANIKDRAQEDDLVVLYISSHGSPSDKDGNISVIAYDSVPEPREEIWKTAITGKKHLGDFIQGMKAKRFVAILDTCFSGGAYSGINGFYSETAKSLGAEDYNDGMSKEQKASMLGAKDIVLEEPTTSFSSNGWGKVLISASGPGEQSWEDASVDNSYFTHYLINGLKQNKGSVANAFSYAKPIVTERVFKEKKGKSQIPQAVADNKDWNIKLAK
ncbi:MAG: caspase family protein [Nitrospirae bacterium]|nr:caspase family protein [Nitrospirota bacterium]